ncbi:MAG TPA: NAD(P)-dependent oxidoreductase [Patescibacteria group bacterium]|nr:NAD(P)-dependent oxidoreductase [Patescibacteria group bacterium]
MSREISTVLVTAGVTGKIGGEVMRLAARDYPDKHFIATSRDRNLVDSQRANNVDVRFYDLQYSTLPEIRTMLTGVDAVIHTAASTNETNDFELHRIMNYEATSRLAYVCAEQGVKLQILGSTAMHTLTPEGIIDDYTDPFSMAAYGGSKINAFKAAKFLETPDTIEKGYGVTQTVPGLTIGIDDNWSNNIVGLLRNGLTRFGARALLNTEVAWSYQEDVANLLIQIALNPNMATTDRYLAINGMVKINDLLGLYAGMIDVPVPKIPIWKPKAELIAKTVLTYMDVVHHQIQPVSPELIPFGLYGDKRQFRPVAAARDFGWESKSFEEVSEIIRNNFVPEPGEATSFTQALGNIVDKKVDVETIKKKVATAGLVVGGAAAAVAGVEYFLGSKRKTA